MTYSVSILRAGSPGRSADFRLAGRSFRAGCRELVREFREIRLCSERESMASLSPRKTTIAIDRSATSFSGPGEVGRTEHYSRLLKRRSESFEFVDPESHQSVARIWISFCMLRRGGVGSGNSVPANERIRLRPSHSRSSCPCLVEISLRFLLEFPDELRRSRVAAFADCHDHDCGPPPLPTRIPVPTRLSFPRSRG